jgi:hypothetical protein
MSTKFFQGDESPKSLIKKYKQYQSIGKDLSQKIFQEFSDSQSIRAVGKLMGIWHGGTLVLESEEEFNFIMDFSLFEYLVKEKNFIQRYQEENSELDEKESEMIEAQLLSYTSLFKILETEPANASVKLGDLLGDGQEVKVINVNLSRTAKPGLLMFTRVIPFPDFNMTSGMYCIFPEDSARRLLKSYKIMHRKVKSEIESAQRFIAFFKLNRREGLEIRTTDKL